MKNAIINQPKMNYFVNLFLFCYRKKNEFLFFKWADDDNNHSPISKNINVWMYEYDPFADRPINGW